MTFDSDFATNINFADRSNFSISTINALTVSANSHVSMKVSLQWLFENEPALETDLDVTTYVEVVNPDGIPGSGDERFRTVLLGGHEARARLCQLTQGQTGHHCPDFTGHQVLTRDVL